MMGKSSLRTNIPTVQDSTSINLFVDKDSCSVQVSDPQDLFLVMMQAVETQPLRADRHFQMTAEIGAEVVCCQEDAKQSRYSVQKVPIVNTLTRRCSYEEVIHSEMEPQKNSFQNFSVEECMLRATQWAITLKDVIEDRTPVGLVGSSPLDRSVKCVCSKAHAIREQIKTLEKCFSKVFAQGSDIDHTSMSALWEALSSMQEKLGTNVSIQISNPGPEAITRSNFILRDVTNADDYLKQLMATLATFTNDLLLVKSCQIHSKPQSGLMERDGEEHIRSRVASLLTETSPDSNTPSDDVSMKDTDVLMQDMVEEINLIGKTPPCGRKRKQIFPKVVLPPPQPVLNLSPPTVLTAYRPRRTPPTSPTSSSSPSKRPRRLNRPGMTPSGLMSPAQNVPVAPQNSSPALDLLETKKKGQKNGMYQWVLWREALKGEKARRTSCSSIMGSPQLGNSSQQFRNSDTTLWRKLSFS